MHKAKLVSPASLYENSNALLTKGLRMSELKPLQGRYRRILRFLKYLFGLVLLALEIIEKFIELLK